MKPSMSSFATTLRSRRKELGLTLQEIADKCGCSKAYLSGIENDKFPHPPSDKIIRKVERTIRVPAGTLQAIADWMETPESVKKMIAKARTRNAEQEKAGLPGSAIPVRSVPLINRIAAGAAAEFTDLDYPVDVADEYVEVPAGPEVVTQWSFAARVSGDSMLPEYRDGEVVVFSPTRDPTNGSDCFVRLLPDHETTFKRVYFEPDGSVRLVPLNRDFETRVVPREQVSGIWPAVSVVRPVGTT